MFSQSQSQSVSMSWCRAQSGTFDQRSFFFESHCPVIWGRPLWREVGSVLQMFSHTALSLRTGRKEVKKGWWKTIRTNERSGKGTCEKGDEANVQKRYRIGKAGLRMSRTSGADNRLSQGGSVSRLNSSLNKHNREAHLGSYVPCHSQTKKKLHGLSPRANYTDRATAACRPSDCQLLRIEGATWSAWLIPTAVFSVF
jgi:hypothetical protein